MKNGSQLPIQPHLQRVKQLLHCFTIEDETDRLSPNFGKRLQFYDAANPRRKQITTPHFLVWNKGIHISCGTSLLHNVQLILQRQLKLPLFFQNICSLVALKWQITADYPTRINMPIREAGPVLAHIRIVYYRVQLRWSGNSTNCKKKTNIHHDIKEGPIMTQLQYKSFPIRSV
jgi:hypothetical protein